MIAVKTDNSATGMRSKSAAPGVKIELADSFASQSGGGGGGNWGNLWGCVRERDDSGWKGSFQLAVASFKDKILRCSVSGQKRLNFQPS